MPVAMMVVIAPAGFTQAVHTHGATMRVVSMAGGQAEYQDEQTYNTHKNSFMTEVDWKKAALRWQMSPYQTVARSG